MIFYLVFAHDAGRYDGAPKAVVIMVEAVEVVVPPPETIHVTLAR